MKNLLFFFVVLSIYACAQIGQPKIYVPNTVHDFGDIKEGATVKYKFTVVNNGTDILKIDRVASSCGCTAVQPEKNELKPGESTFVGAEFNSTGRMGPQVKYISIFTNDPATPLQQLMIKANVIGKPKDNSNAPQIKFEQTQHDFGKIEEGKINEHIFKFKNLGKENLIINDVRTSCGCTAAVVEGQDLKPGESGSIKIQFDSSGRNGRQSKTIVVLSNDPETPTATLTIYAEITPKN